MDTASLFSVEGKVAVVTGGSRGIGFMIATALVNNGCSKVYITSRKMDACKSATKYLNTLHPSARAIPFAADIADESDQDALLDFVSSSDNHVDILVNNAGANWAAPFESFPVHAFDKVVQLNLTACFFMTQAFSSLLSSNSTLHHPCSRI